MFLPSFIITHTYPPLYGRPRAVPCRRSRAVRVPNRGGKEEEEEAGSALGAAAEVVPEGVLPEVSPVALHV